MTRFSETVHNEPFFTAVNKDYTRTTAKKLVHGIVHRF